MGEPAFGLEIKLLRERQKLSAKDLALRIGLSPSQMSRLESGQRRVDAVLLSKIARALDVHPSYFFDGPEARAPLPARKRSQEPQEAQPLLPPPPSSLGRLLRNERRRRHLTAEELAHKVGKGKSLLLDIEAGRTDMISGELLQKMARALKLDPELLLEAQRQEIRELRRSLRRLERAHTERTLGDLQVEGPGTSRPGIPLMEAKGGGPPRFFDKGTPEGKVLDYLYLPGLRLKAGFATLWHGDSMQSPQPPSFRPGSLLIFDTQREARHRDLVLALLEGGSSFRQLFLDPKGRVRLQPLNLEHPPQTLERDTIKELFPLVAHLETF